MSLHATHYNTFLLFAINHILSLLFLIIQPPPSSTLFPYTTLFRSLKMRTVSVGPSQPIAPAGTIRSPGMRIVPAGAIDRKSTRLNSSHRCISYAVFCLKKKKKTKCLLNGDIGEETNE